MRNWLVRDWQWPTAALFTSFFLLVITPIIGISAGVLLALIYVQLPIYMLHQWEEHRGDRFRLYINRTIGGGQEALTPTATFWINSLGVWTVDLIAIYLAWAISPAAGLATGYLALVNAVPHIGMTIKRREYNPGVVTAILLLLPLGGWCVVQVGANASWQEHLIGLAVALGVHIAIIVYIAQRITRLKASLPHFDNLKMPQSS